ncbi:MAG TPA: hypothetical protein P5548_03990 [Candidatus Moranbacteria bacterium]|nr:hypothetical protein [Candidatus Moranbacteria bacterium]
MNDTKIKLKNDKYRIIRGGHSRLLNISCEKCGVSICRYQKDGSGNLRRMYVDRIINAKFSLTKNMLACSNGHILGVKIIYDKENRPAFRLFVDAVIKKIIKT